MATTATQTIYHATTLVLKTCSRCGINYGLNQAHYDATERDFSISWYCPGCGQSWQRVGQTVEQQLKADLEHARDRAAFWRSESAAQERRRFAVKGQMTKLRKRIGAGVCPECTRTFQSLATHMRQQHPDFVPEPTA